MADPSCDRGMTVIVNFRSAYTTFLKRLTPEGPDTRKEEHGKEKRTFNVSRFVLRSPVHPKRDGFRILAAILNASSEGLQTKNHLSHALLGSLDNMGRTARTKDTKPVIMLAIILSC